MIEKAAAIEVRNQQIMLQTTQLEQSNAEKSKLMSIISHDLRAPLVNIQNYLELLNEHEVDDQQRIMLEKSLLTSTRITMDMLSNMLYWSKTQMEGSTVKLTHVNLLNSLQSTLEMEKMLAVSKNISLSYNIPSQVTVIADEDMLQLVVRNLANNAIKFTPEGGAITIEAHVELTECKITIKDNGTGISADKIKNMFTLKAEPSFGTGNERGAGLGLLLCKEFTERQSGRIGFDSNPDKGSSFYIFMPMA